MTYLYAMNSANYATLYRQTDDGELVAEAEIDGRHLRNPGDIAAIARATVAALNGAKAEPRVVWHPKAVEALRAARDYPDGLARSQLALGCLAREALALVDQPAPAETVVGWTALDSNGDPSPWHWKILDKCRAANPGCRIVRLVEEPAP